MLFSGLALDVVKSEPQKIAGNAETLRRNSSRASASSILSGSSAGMQHFDEPPSSPLNTTGSSVLISTESVRTQASFQDNVVLPNQDGETVRIASVRREKDGSTPTLKREGPPGLKSEKDV